MFSQVSVCPQGGWGCLVLGGGWSHRGVLVPGLSGPGAVWSRGVPGPGAVWSRGVPGPGAVWSQGVPGPGGAWSGGCLAPGVPGPGVPGQGGVWPRGCLVRGVSGPGGAWWRPLLECILVWVFIWVFTSYLWKQTRINQDSKRE